jgi:hypothetical protein
MKTSELHTEARIIVLRRTLLQKVGDAFRAVALFLLIAILWVLLVIVHAVSQSVEATVRDTHVTILEAGLTLKNLREASEEWKKSSSAQAAYATAAAKQIQADLITANRLLGDIDAQVPRFSDLVVHADGAIVQASAQLTATAQGMQPVLAGLANDADELGQTLGDPAIKSTLENLNVASFELAESSKHLTTMLESGQATAADVQKVADKVAYEYTRTKNLAWALFKELAGLGGSLAQMAK